MSTTGCDVGQSVTSHPSSRERSFGVERALGSPSFLLRAGSSARWSRSRPDARGGAAPCGGSRSATCAPSRSLSAASSMVAMSPPAPATRNRSCSEAPNGSAGELTLDSVGEPAHVLARERASCGDCARVARRVAVALLELGGRDDDMVDEPGERALARTRDVPVSPSKASTASRVNVVPPSWLIAIRTSASGACPRTRSSD